MFFIHTCLTRVSEQMAVSHKSQAKSVVSLLGLFGYEVERSEVLKSIEVKEKRKLFERILAQADHFCPVNFQTRTSKIFAFLASEELVSLTDLKELRVTEDAGVVLKEEVRQLSTLHELDGTFKERLFILASNEPESLIKLVKLKHVLKEPVWFTKCIFLNEEKGCAHNPVGQVGMDAIKKDFGLRAVFACSKRDKPDRVVLTKLILSVDENIRKFLDLSVTTVVEKPKKSHKKSDKERKRKAPEGQLDKEERTGSEKKLKLSEELAREQPMQREPAQPEPTLMEWPTQREGTVQQEGEFIIDRDTTDYTLCKNWFYQIATVF